MLLSLESLIPKHFQKKALMSSPEFTIIDRRDFIRQIEQLLLRDGSDPIPDTFFATKERRTITVTVHHTSKFTVNLAL